MQPDGTRRRWVLAECPLPALGEVVYLPSASWRHSAKINGRQTAGTAVARAGHVRGLCRVRARWHSAKSNGYRVPYFADGQLSAKLGHAVCHVFAECPFAGTRQRSCLPSAVVWHSTKAATLGNYWFSGSAKYCIRLRSFLDHYISYDHCT